MRSQREGDWERGRGIEGNIWRYYCVGFEEGGGDQPAKECRCPREIREKKDFPLKPPERT